MPLDSTNFKLAVIPHPSFTEAQAKLLLDGLALLESEERRFDMSKWCRDDADNIVGDTPVCGTVGCIGGHICMAAGRNLDHQTMGMTALEYHALFYNPQTEDGGQIGICNITCSMGKAALRRFITNRETWFDGPGCV